MKKSIKDIKIFIGHSIVDLSNNIGDIVGFLNDTISEQFNTTVETYVCENRLASSQDEINYYIANNADLAVFCFINKVGEYSFEEYKVARDTYKQTNFERPKIAVYFKSGVDETKEKKDEIIGDRVYYNDFETFESIKLDLLMLLKSISKETFDFEFTDKDFLINGKKVKNISIQQLPIYKNNKDVKKLEEQIKELSKKAIELQNNGEIDECDEVCDKIAALQSQKSMKIQAMLSLSQRFVDDCVNNENDDTISLARLLVKQGNVEKAISLFPSLSQLNSESETIAKVQEDSKSLAKKEIAKYMELIDYHVLSDINAARDEINGCTEGIIKLVKQFRIFDFDIIEKLISYCQSRVSTVDIKDFLSELVEEKEVRLNKTYNLFALCKLYHIGYYDIDRNSLVKRIQDAYFELLEEKNYLENRIIESQAFSIFQSHFTNELDPVGFSNVLSRRVKYFLEIDNPNYKQNIESEILCSRLGLAKIYSIKGMSKECLGLIDSNYKDIIENIKKNRLSSLTLLGLLAELVLIMKLYDHFDEIYDLCIEFGDELKNSPNQRDQESAISLYTYASTFCSTRGDFSNNLKLIDVLDGLYKKCIALNDAKYKMSYLNFLYLKVIADMTTGNSEACNKDIEVIFDMEDNIDPADLKANAVSIAANKFAIVSMFVQAQVLDGDIIAGFGLGAYDLLVDSGISLKDSGLLMAQSLVLGVVGLYLNADYDDVDELLEEYTDKLYEILLKHNEYLTSPECVATIMIFLKVLLQLMETAETEDYEKFKAVIDEIKGEETEVNNFFSAIKDMQDISVETIEVIYKDKDELTEEDILELNNFVSKLPGTLEKLSNERSDLLINYVNSNKNKITRIYRLIDLEHGKQLYEQLLAIIEKSLSKNEFMLISIKTVAISSILYGYLDQEDYDEDFANKLKSDLFEVFDGILTSKLNDANLLAINGIDNTLVCFDEIDNEEALSIANELFNKVKTLNITDENILKLRNALSILLIGIKHGFEYDESLKMVQILGNEKEATEEEFIEAIKKIDAKNKSKFLPRDVSDDDLDEEEVESIESLRKVMKYVSQNDLEEADFYEFTFGILDSILPVLEIDEEYFDHFQFEYFLFILFTTIDADDNPKYFNKIAEYTHQILESVDLSDIFTYYLLSITFLTMVVGLSKNNLEDSAMFESAKEKIEEYINVLAGLEDDGKFFALLALNKTASIFSKDIKNSENLQSIFISKCLELTPDDGDDETYLRLYSNCCDLLIDE